jgi:hypothetical protein
VKSDVWRLYMEKPRLDQGESANDGGVGGDLAAGATSACRRAGRFVMRSNALGRKPIGEHQSSCVCIVSLRDFIMLMCVHRIHAQE